MRMGLARGGDAENKLTSRNRHIFLDWFRDIGVLGESSQPPRIAPARGPPLWELAEGFVQAGNNHEWVTAEPEPEIEFDQSVAW